jgi:hypothetical protein
MQEIERNNMPRMTDEEANALAEQVTLNPPKVTGDGKNGFFMKHKGNVIILDDVSATWLRVTSESTHKTPSDIVSEMIREKIAVVV